MSRKPEHIEGYGDVYTLQRAVAVCCDAAGISVDELRVADKSVAYDEPQGLNTPRDRTLEPGFRFIQSVCAEFSPAWSVLSPAWKLSGEQLVSLTKTEWRSLDLYERWRAGDDAGDEEKVLVLKVGFVDELAKRRRKPPRRDRPPWQRVALELLETTGKCSLPGLKAEWLHQYDERPETCYDDKDRPCLKFGADKPTLNNVEKYLTRRRKDYR